MSTVIEHKNQPAAHADTDRARVAAAFRNFLEALGLDLSDPNLLGTDERVARACEEILGGLSPAAEPRISTFPNDSDYGELITVKDIPFYSLCAHHFLPFFGTAHVAYIPGQRLAGLSKLPRVVNYFAQRPQLQERITTQVADLLLDRLEPIGVIVVLEARHLCMEMRGVSRPGVMTRTCTVRGDISETQKHHFLSSLQGSGPTIV